MIVTSKYESLFDDSLLSRYMAHLYAQYNLHPFKSFPHIFIENNFKESITAF